MISYLKSNALNSLRGRWAEPIIATLLYFCVALVISAMSNTLPVLAFIVNIFIVLPLSFGFYLYFMRFNEDRSRIENLFYYFQNGSDLYLKTIGLSLLIGLFTFLWSLLFIIPGIIMKISYSMSYYIMIENPEIEIREAINMSKKMMHGHKLEYFLLNLSFIGWSFLALFTFGIGYLWLIPYMQLTQIEFYEEVKIGYIPYY